MTTAPKPLNLDFFAADTLEVAKALLGVTLIYRDCAGIIVETEAYKDDPASHFVTRPNKGAMLGENYGHIYIYKIYGMHHCLNFTTDKDHAGAVLIRALQPLRGIEEMRRRRGVSDLTSLANGPAKLFVALGLDPALHGRPATEVFTLLPPESPVDVGTSQRIGISLATHLPWRFFVRGSRFLSRREK
jgi:DNA-3-methyladenine glycosylase